MLEPIDPKKIPLIEMLKSKPLTRASNIEWNVIPIKGTCVYDFMRMSNMFSYLYPEIGSERN